jgi:multidrug resistance protein, MATE family
MSEPTAASPPPDRPPPTLRTLLTLAWPVVVSRASQVVVGLGDALMVAVLGEAALAATTTGAMDSFALLMFPMGVVFIVQSFSSQLFGRKDLAGARRYGFYGVLVALMAQVLAVVAYFAAGPILHALPLAGDVRGDMLVYLQIRLLSTGPAVGIEALGNYYGGLGNTQLPMRVNLATMVLDLFLNWVFIFGHLGAPAMGVKGAALTSTVTTTLAVCWLFGVFLRDGRRAGAPMFPRLQARELLRMLRFGVPSGANWFFEFFAFIVFLNVVVAHLGTTALAGLNAVFQINSVSFMPAFGLASAGAILVGQAIGAGARDEVPRIVRLTFTTTAVWQGLVGLSYVLLPELLFGPFARGDGAAELRATGARMLMLSAAWQLFDATATTLGEALRAAGDTAFAMWARIAIAWGVFTPGAYLTVSVLGWGDRAAVFWLVLARAVLAGVLFARFRSGAWRKFELTEPPVDA